MRRARTLQRGGTALGAPRMSTPPSHQHLGSHVNDRLDDVMILPVCVFAAYPPCCSAYRIHAEEAVQYLQDPSRSALTASPRPRTLAYQTPSAYYLSPPSALLPHLCQRVDSPRYACHREADPRAVSYIMTRIRRAHPTSSAVHSASESLDASDEVYGVSRRDEGMWNRGVSGSMSLRATPPQPIPVNSSKLKREASYHPPALLNASRKPWAL